MMKYVVSFGLCFPLVAALAGCSGGADPAPGSESFAQGSNVVSYDPASGVVTLDGVAVRTDVGDLVLSNGAVSVFRAFNITTRGGTPEAYAAVTSSLGAAAGASVSGEVIGRSVVPVLPVAGSATYSADYAAQIVAMRNDDRQFALGLVTGDAMLAADFASRTLTGAITDRALRQQSDGGPFDTFGLADIAIAGGVIADNGTFDANVTGGQLTSASGGGDYGTTSQGELTGLFGRPDGGAVAGVVILPHVLPQSSPVYTFTYEERGVIIGRRD